MYSSDDQYVLNFFLTVEPAPGVDSEGLEVAKDCLTEVFRPHQLPESERPEPNILLNIFSSQESSTEDEAKTSHSEEAKTTSSAQNHVISDVPGTSKVQVCALSFTYREMIVTPPAICAIVFTFDWSGSLFNLFVLYNIIGLRSPVGGGGVSEC